MFKGTCSFLFHILVLAFFLTGCGDKLILKETNFNGIKGWQHDNHSEALISFKKSCSKFNTLPKHRKIHTSGLGGTYGNWQKLCNNAANINLSDKIAVRDFFESNFTPYLATNWGKEEGTFTGYYEIELKGSRTKTSEYKYPVYAKPNGIINGKKYYSRKQIENGKLEGKGLEIAWVKDPVRLFFLHVQGSGRIRLEDGSAIRIGYNGKNNHKYVSIGRYMIDKGYIKEENISAPAIKKWLYDHPYKIKSVLNQNPSYVFFREIGSEGPIGGQGVPLTPMRSLAVDKRYVPYGAPVWVDVGLNSDNKQFKKLLIAQDTGSAIRGPVRGDLFFGHGDEAEKLAGYQNNKGKYFILLPRKSAL